MYLCFISFPYTDMTEMVELFTYVRQLPTCSTDSIFKLREQLKSQ